MIKNFNKIILGSLFIIGTALPSTTNSKRTYLAPRPVGFNLPMEYTTWHNHVLNRAENKFHCHAQLTPFYQASVKGEDVGKYFGVGNGKNSFTVGTWTAFGLPTNIDLSNKNYIHTYDSASSIVGTLSLNPKQEIYGARVDFFANMAHPFHKLFIKASMPFAHVDNDLHFNATKEVEDAKHNYISSFFEGKDISQDAQNKQDALEYGKFKHGRLTKTGVADIDLFLGYRLVENEKDHCFLQAGITIPTGNRVRGEYLFEPVYGNGHHFGIGAGLEAWHKLWTAKHHEGKILFNFNYSYLFEGTEKRMVPFVASIYKAPYLHYALAGKAGNVAGTPLFPAANVLTQDLSVRPGNQIDMMVALSFKSSRFLIDLGYDLYARQKESVRLKHCWEDEIYGLALSDFNVTEAFDINENSWQAINRENLNVNGAATPSYLTNKVFGSIGYLFNLSQHPANVAFGASYEFAAANHELEGYAFWAKAGLSF